MSVHTPELSSEPEDLLVRLARYPLWVYCLTAVVFYAFCDYGGDPGKLVRSLGDTDDALRLATVRDLLSNGVWFDRTFPRLGGSEPLLSHWSRLLDAPIAFLMALFGLVLPSATAELATRALWPMLVLFALIRFFAGFAERREGRTAALVMIGLIVFAVSVTIQFGLGRIDHHNVMIACAGGGILFLAESFAAPRMGWIAGILLGLGTAVGYEAFPLTAASLAVAALLAAWSGRGLDGISNAATSFAATLAVAMVLTIAPWQWLDVKCDALSANLVLLAAAGAVGTFAVTRCGAASNAAIRIAILAVSGLVGMVLFGLFEPRCLQGPLSQVDPAVLPIWLDHVQDTRSFFEVSESAPQLAILAAMTFLFGLGASVSQLRQKPDETGLVLSALLILAGGLAIWQIKFIPYATLLAIPPLGFAISRLEGNPTISTLTQRLLAFLFANQQTALAVIAASIGLFGTAGTAGSSASQSSAASLICFETAHMRALDALPNGRFAGHYDLGPFIVANTHHEALAAPYHRIDKAILEVHAIANAPADEAARRLEAAGVDYVIDCVPMKPKAGTPESAFVSRLRADNIPDFLEPVELPEPSPFRVWRVHAARKASQ